jgi:cyclase
MKMKSLISMCLAATSGLAVAQNAAPPAQPFVVHQLKPNVYWIAGGGGNSTVIVGDTGVIVIDAKTTAAGGKELLDDIAKITPKPVNTLIVTHSDGDHLNGLAAFPPGVKLIEHENNKKEQQAAAATPAGAANAAFINHQPTQLITKNKETMTIDGEKLELYHWAPAHTSGDLVVYLPNEKIVATGDIIASNSADPRIHTEKNGRTDGWIESAKGIAKLDSDQFIPGHGDLQTKAQVQQRLDNAIAKRDKVIALAKQGKSLDEITTAVGDPPRTTAAPGPNFKTWTEVVYDEQTHK